MAKKTYRTYHLKGLQVLLFDKLGKLIEVNFRGGCQIDSTSKFTTSDEALQNALEKSSGFGRDFYLEAVHEDNPTTSVNVKDAEPAVEETAEKEETVAENNGVETVEVADKSEAIEWLKEHNPEAGYTAAKLRSKDAFANACAENNVEFVFA